MKTLPTGLADHLASGATTLCRCWRLTRADGMVLGFTDHDRDIEFDGVVHSASGGLSTSADVAASGLAVGGFEIDGALSDARLAADDLAAGAYDGATVELWLVNWAEIGERVKLRRGTIGEVTVSDGAFRAEVRGPAADLDAVRGRLFQPRCDADLGDGRCGVDLDAGAYRLEGTVEAAEGRSVVSVTGLGGYADGWFSRGRLLVTSGTNAGRASEIKAHSKASGRVDLWQPMPEAIRIGDGVVLTAGCDKRFATCAEKFANALNFRGFPHMPGNDVALASVSSDGDNDGGTLA
ncbi:DUF2163 domain-containing protein [Amorphus orientalis]|uniref:Phage protein (TIGR02218 family) n=1 Tax=Amorphus orientalis TaxID=649198 RepID=A0AAE3VTB1_9HYPH|nr:DUF2163 domain-containing protein [Amorphus orientalis]MDQ0317827.1 putative phage protein (TIGR02218 family) [Amorphus orientalis]